MQVQIQTSQFSRILIVFKLRAKNAYKSVELEFFQNFKTKAAFHISFTYICNFQTSSRVTWVNFDVRIVAAFLKTTIVMDMLTAMMAAMRPTARLQHVLENSCALTVVLMESQNVLPNRNYAIKKKTAKITLMKNLHAVSV